MKNNDTARSRIEEIIAKDNNFFISEKNIDWICKKLEKYFGNNLPCLSQTLDDSEYILNCEWNINDIVCVLNIFFEDRKGYLGIFCDENNNFIVNKTMNYYYDHYYYDNIDLNNDNKWGEIVNIIDHLKNQMENIELKIKLVLDRLEDSTFFYLFILEESCVGSVWKAASDFKWIVKYSFPFEGIMEERFDDREQAEKALIDYITKIINKINE